MIKSVTQLLIVHARYDRICKCLKLPFLLRCHRRFYGDLRIQNRHIFQFRQFSLICFAVVGAQVPFSINATVLFCTASAFMSASRFSITG